MPTPTTAEVLKQYRDEMRKMEAAGQEGTSRYSDYQQRVNELEYEQYEENKAREAREMQGKKAGGPVKYKCGGKMHKMRAGGSCGTKKMAKGGGVKGAGCCTKGVRKCKMY